MSNEEQAVGPSILDDQPIRSISDDLYGYARLAEHAVGFLSIHSRSRSVVVGIQGPWGSGKSSLMNLMQIQLCSMSRQSARRPPIVVEFNPWHYHRVDQLLTRLFRELTVKLRAHGSKLGGSAVVDRAVAGLAAFSKLLEPAAALAASGPEGKGLAMLAGIFGAIMRRRPPVDEDEALEATRHEVSEALAGLDRRVVVFVDDIDRLEPDRLTMILKLVRLTASFDNVTYVLAYDRGEVEGAITAALGVSGQAYLEKIVQVVLDLPPLDPAVRRRVLVNRLMETVTAAGLGLEATDVDHLLDAGLSELVQTPRDIVRYTSGIGLTSGLVQGEVNARDFLGVEALRIHAPRVYGLIRDNPLFFLGPANAFEDQGFDGAEVAERFRELCVGVEDMGRPSVNRLVDDLLPAVMRLRNDVTVYDGPRLNTLRQHRRLGSHVFFPRYFLFGVPHGEIAESEVSRLASTSDPASIDAAMGRYADDGVGGKLLERLLDHTDAIRAAGTQAPWLSAAQRVSKSFTDQSPDYLHRYDWQRVEDFGMAILDSLPGGAERAELLSKMCAHTEGLAAHSDLIRLLSNNTMSAARELPHDTEFISREHFTKVQDALVERIQAEVGNRGLAKSTGRGLSTVLYAWREATDDIFEPAAFARTLIATDGGLFQLLEGFGHYQESELQPRFRRKDMSNFVDVAKLESRVREIRDSRDATLSASQRALLDGYLAADLDTL